MESQPRFRPGERGRPYRSLRGRSEFARAYREGSRQRCGAVLTITAQSGDGDIGPPRVGVVAGRKVGSAVDRNRAKRRLREAASRCDLKPDTVYLLVADQGVLTAEFDRLVHWIGNCITDLEAAEEKL